MNEEDEIVRQHATPEEKAAVTEKLEKYVRGNSDFSPSEMIALREVAASYRTIAGFGRVARWIVSGLILMGALISAVVGAWRTLFGGNA